MPVSRFARGLVGRLQRVSVPVGLTNEKALEQQVVLPEAERLVRRHPDVLLYVHPWGGTRKCAPACAVLPPGRAGRVHGCPTCWEVSKKQWASVGAFGTHHTFDLAAIDKSKQTLAVELKLSRPRNGRLPSGDIQRFLGQCALASAKHDVVVGYFVCQGDLDERWHKDTAAAMRWFRKHKIYLAFRYV